MVSWDTAEARPATPSPGVILMNEVLDALPVKRAVGTAKGVHEIRVGEDAGRLVEVLVPAAQELVAQIGVTVHSVRVIPLRHYKNRVIVKLTVLADNRTERLTGGNFWPTYLTCVPWRTRRSDRDTAPRIEPKKCAAPVNKQP